jgi:serine/threonine protein kinase
MPADPNRDGYIHLIEARSEIDGRYSGLKFKGDGHFSLVFSCTDRTSGRKVAVKVFRPDRMTERYRFDCFCREAIILEELQGSPNILEWVGARGEFTETLHHSSGLSLDYNFSYFGVELAATDLATIVGNDGWDAERKLVAFRDMCKAVQRIHRQGIAHRDIKPNNFLVMADGAVKLSDFGTARRTDGVEPAALANYSFAPGDIRYTPPEMNALLHDENPAIALKGDIFSLGATLFELFTGAVLVVQLYDLAFAADLTRAMGAVQKRERERMYLLYVQSLDAAHPLPSISAYASNVPLCIKNLVDGLYRGMAALDFRKRIPDFETVFLKIEQCLIVLRNQEKYRKWQLQKQVYRENHLRNLARHQGANLASAKGKSI